MKRSKFFNEKLGDDDDDDNNLSPLCPETSNNATAQNDAGGDRR